MRAVFIYPPISFKEENPSSGFTPPLGALYMATILQNHGHEAHVIDANAEQLTLNKLKRRVESLDPDMIGLTCLTFNLEACQEIINTLRKNLDTYTVVGGPHTSAVPPEHLRLMGADAYVINEGESVIKDIIEKKPKGIIHAPEIKDINKIPFPDRTLLDDVKYGKVFGLDLWSGKATAILTSRGCKYACTFCNRPKKQCFRSRSPKNILGELKEIDKMGYSAVEIVDDNFTNDPENVVELARLIKREKLELDFIGEGRIDAASDKLYKSMKEMGMAAVSHGVESVKPEIIKWYNKTDKPEKWPKYIKKTLDLCEKYNLICLESLIFSAPMESKEDMRYSIDFLIENGADFVNGNVLMFLVGSPIWHWARKLDKVKPDQYVSTAPEIGLTPYTQEEIQEMCDMCTNYNKREGWKKAFRKILNGKKYHLIVHGFKTFLTKYFKIRKVRKDMYLHGGYGKSYMKGENPESTQN